MHSPTGGPPVHFGLWQIGESCLVSLAAGEEQEADPALVAGTAKALRKATQGRRMVAWLLLPSQAAALPSREGAACMETEQDLVVLCLCQKCPATVNC